MEIRYKRTYLPAKGKRYTAGEIQAMLGYAVEAADPRVVLKEGKLAPGEICMMLFAITPEEYAWKDSEPRALDHLVEKMCRQVPADRLLGWRICDLKGAVVQKNVQLKTGESIDGGAFAALMKDKIRQSMTGPIDALIQESRRLQNLCADKNAPESVKQDWQAARAAMGKAILGLEKIYVVDELLVGNRWPAVGFDGRIEIFTTRERAERIKPQITAAMGGMEIWTIRELPGTEIVNYLRNCGMDGLNALRVDNGFAAADLSLKDFMPDFMSENMPLRSFVIREIEAGVRWNKLKELKAEEKHLRSSLEGMLTFRNFAWREIGNASLYAVCAGGAREKCVVLGGKDGGEKMLAVFTDRIRAAAFAEKLAGNPVPVAMKFGELTLRAQAFGGLLIDIGVLNYRLPKTEFDKVRELRGKPPVVVRVKQPEAEAAAPQTRPQADMGSLPNPDEFDAPKLERRPEEKPEEALPAKRDENNKNDEKTVNKGFFKKLFGK